MDETPKRMNPVGRMGLGLLKEWPLSVNLATTLVFIVFGQSLLADLSHPVRFTLILTWLLLIILASLFAVVIPFLFQYRNNHVGCIPCTNGNGAWNAPYDIALLIEKWNKARGKSGGETR